MILVVTDRKQSIRLFLEQMELIASGHPDMIILREKDLTYDEYLVLANDCKRICDEHDVRFCINSFIDVAKELGVKDIQLPMDVLKERYDDLGGMNVGASIHDFEEIDIAEKLGAKRLIFGNIFETSCKPDLKGTGTEKLRILYQNTKLPVFAIGGITPNNVQSVYECKVSGVCVMSSVMRSDDPVSLINKLRNVRF